MKDKEVTQVLTETTTRIDNGFERTALIVGERGLQSVDVLTKDGVFLCRLNICAHADGSWGNIDVILEPERYVGTFLAWKKGVLIVNERLIGNSVFAVNIACFSASKNEKGGKA